MNNAKKPRTGGVDYAGYEFPESPNHSAFLRLLGSPTKKRITLALEGRYQGSFYATADLSNQRELLTPHVTVVGLRSSYDFEFGTLTVYDDNLLDEEYLGGRDQQRGAYVGAPRAVGAQFDLRWRKRRR